MAGHAVIADIGQYLLELLRESMVPDAVQTKDMIAFHWSGGDSVLGLALYNTEILSRSFPERAALPLSLKYMLYVNSKASADAKALSDYRILGKAISVLKERPIIRRESPFLGSGDMPPEIAIENVTADDRVKICEHICGSFMTAIFLGVSPVLIDSGVSPGAARVLHG